jgi:hypothetical protein
MARFIKKNFYVINILTIIYIAFIISFSIYYINTTFKSLVDIDSNIGKKYNESIDNYKKVIAFILKNKLPQNITYFNAIGSATYDLPTVKKFQTGTPKDILTNKYNSKEANNAGGIVAKCNDGNCITVVVDPKETLNKIPKSKLWEHYGEITTIHLSKTTLLRTSINLFLEANKKFLFITLMYFLTLYIFQSLLLFKKNKINASLVATMDKIKKELNEQSTKCDVLYDNVLFAFDLADEYFTHYIDQLLARDVYMEEIQLTTILQQIENFFNFQLIKKNLKFILEFKDIKPINTDSEIIFIVLLNLISRSINRSKTSSNVNMKIFQQQDATNIEISDAGYEYNKTLGSRIQIHELPEPILEKLCQKLKLEIKETRKDMLNIISIQIMNSEIYELDGDETTDKTIKIRITPIWQ